MNQYPNDIAQKYLDAAYDQLEKSIKRIKKKVIHDSLLLTLLKLSSNDVFKIISESTISVYNESLPEIKTLISEGCIKRASSTNSKNTFMITSKGIYVIEARTIGLNIERILDFIQVDVFDFPEVNKPLNDKEKVVIFSLLSLRAFSIETAMNLFTDELCDRWQLIIENIIIPFLVEHHVINSSSIFPKKVGLEHPISYLLRHANDLPKKTNNLFTSTKSNLYYLSLVKNDTQSTRDHISLLLSKIFPKIDTISYEQEIINLLNSTAHDHGLFVMNSLDFITFDWDQVIKDAVERFFLGLDE